jgi:hypothetical protein
VARPTWRRVDRSIAGVAATALAAVLVVTVAVSDEAVPDLARHHPDAAAALLERTRAGEHASYVVEYAAERRRPDGAALPFRTLEARSPRTQYSRNGATLTVETTDAVYHCERIEGEPTCFQRSTRPVLSTSAVLQTVIEMGTYGVLERDARSITGVPTRCFSLTATTPTRVLPELGTETQTCLTDAGVPLYDRRVSGVVDTREAVRMVADAEPASLRPVVEGFEALIDRLPR